MLTINRFTPSTNNSISKKAQSREITTYITSTLHISLPTYQVNIAMVREEESKSPMVAFLASPGMGHLIPLGEFATRLASHHNFTITVFSASDSDSTPSKAHKAYLRSLPDSITSIPLPAVHLHDQPANILPETRIFLTMSRSVPHLRQAMKALASTSHVVALVVDLFGADALDVARELGVGAYIFYPSTCTSLSLFFHLPHLDRTVAGQFRDLDEPIRLPGCVAINGRDIEDALQDRTNDAYELMLQHSRRFMAADGIFVNTFAAVEPGAIMGLLKEKEQSEIPPVYPVGPLIRARQESGGRDRHGCLKWLDEQPAESVVFVSLGSGGTLSLEQLTELAMGLELSRQRFLWVARSPSEDESSEGSFFTAESEKDPLEFLPAGFLRRTEAAGTVVPSWAPQPEVLGHPAVGGFVTHCGWNSSLESVVHGVPMVAWPLYAEQRMNEAMLVEEMGVALRARGAEEGVVGRAEVGRVVRALMEGVEGEEVRRRVVQLKESAAMAVAPSGSSYLALSLVVNEWHKLRHDHKDL